MATRARAPVRTPAEQGAAWRRRLDDTLAREEATARILRVLSRSPTDAASAFDTIAEAALRLCNATSALVTTFDGKLVHIAALHDLNPQGADAVRHIFPRPASRDNGAARAVLTGEIVHIPDVREDPDFRTIEASIASGFRSVLAVPLLRDGAPIGAISVGRARRGRFSESHIALLRTFADQAVIAIENVRLFNETKEALERQTATAEILGVMAGSPSSVQPVFDAIARRAVELCGAAIGGVFRYDGEQLDIVATHNFTPEARAAVHSVFPMRPDRSQLSARAILTGEVQRVEDVLDDPEYNPSVARAGGWRRLLAVPMLLDRRPLGAIAVSWRDPGAITDRQVELLTTFAAQAVIAIENVRLFRELEARNGDLVNALEQQTATSEILRVISRSQTSLQPVFDAIVRSSVQLCDADHCMVASFDGEVLRPLATWGYSAKAQAVIDRIYPLRPSRVTMLGRVALEGKAVTVEDTLADPDYLRELAEAGGWRSGLCVPMFQDGALIGAISVSRNRTGPFPGQHMEVMKTFAEQAVIAIRNVHLFTELQARTAQLSRSVDELQALSDVGRAVGSTLDLDTVLGTIVSRVASLIGVDGGSVYEYDADAERFDLRATNGLPDEMVEALRAAPILKGEGAMGRLAVTGEPVVFSDIAEETLYQSRLRELLLRLGLRSMAAVPLHIEGRLLGGLLVNRRGVGGFPAPTMELLKRFAMQSALAIGNARLYREVQQKGRELEAASRHKSEFLANMSHELRTPLNAIIGFSEVLVERMFGEVNDKQLEYLHDIHASGHHLLALINDILDLSKIEAGRMELELEPVRLKPLLEDALTLVRERAGRHGVALALDVDPALGAGEVDARKVKQVVINLLSNAVKFTPAGGRVSIAARRVADGAEIAVTDTGVGIPPEDQALVFEEFRQARTAHAGRSEGTGLGLALVKRFVELHGGRVRVDSAPDRGSTFAFILPWRASEEAA